MKPTLANFGLPLVFLELPAMVIALIPILLIETEIVRRRLPMSYWNACKGITVANLVSTFVGIPFAWLVTSVAAQALDTPYSLFARSDSGFLHTLNQVVHQILQNLTLMDHFGASGSAWPILAAATLLLLPCLLVSVWMESGVCQRSWVGHDPFLINRAVRDANCVSYGFLFLFSLCLTTRVYLTGG